MGAKLLSQIQEAPSLLDAIGLLKVNRRQSDRKWTLVIENGLDDEDAPNWRARVLKIYGESEDDSDGNRMQHTLSDLAAALKSWFEGYVGQVYSATATGWISEMLELALSQVNWLEVAAGLIAENVDALCAADERRGE